MRNGLTWISQEQAILIARSPIWKKAGQVSECAHWQNLSCDWLTIHSHAHAHEAVGRMRPLPHPTDAIKSGPWGGGPMRLRWKDVAVSSTHHKDVLHLSLA